MHFYFLQVMKAFLCVWLFAHVSLIKSKYQFSSSLLRMCILCVYIHHVCVHKFKLGIIKLMSRSELMKAGRRTFFVQLNAVNQSRQPTYLFIIAENTKYAENKRRIWGLGHSLVPHFRRM